MWVGLGWYALLFSSFCSFILGFLAVVLYVAYQQAKRLKSISPFQPIVGRSHELMQETTPTSTTPFSSGNQKVDEELGKVLELCLRDYVRSWYHPLITGSPALFTQAKETVGVIVADVSKRCQEPDLLPLFMEALVAIFIDHFRQYKAALAQVTADTDVEKCIARTDNEGWALICAGGEAEIAYLRGITDCLLSLALPPDNASNRLVFGLAQDLLSEQVLLPTAHYISTPFYFNSSVIGLTKDSSLNGESLLIALTCATSDEVGITLKMTTSEITRLKKKGKTELDQFQLNSLNELKNQLTEMREIGLKQAAEVQFRSQFPFLKVVVPEYKTVTEGRVKHVDYKLIVKCQHRQGPEEEWITWRRFSDLHDFHLKLKERTPGLPSLKGQTKPFNKLDPTFLEQKKQKMQNYLKFISSQDFLDSHPDLFGDIILFLTGPSYTRQRTELARTVDKLVQPIVTSVRTRADTVKNLSPGPPRKSFDDYDEEEEEEDGLAILLSLLDEVFDVGDQWLQRQLSNLLRQLLGSLLSDKMGQRMMEALDNYASGDNIAELIGQMRSSMWPDGYPAEARKQLPPETLYLMSLLARTKLIGSVPDDLKRLLGSSTTHKGIIRLFGMFQHESLNLRLLYRLMEAFLCSLFPERDLSQGFDSLRSQIRQKYK